LRTEGFHQFHDLIKMNQPNPPKIDIVPEETIAALHTQVAPPVFPKELW